RARRDRQRCDPGGAQGCPDSGRHLLRDPGGRGGIPHREQGAPGDRFGGWRPCRLKRLCCRERRTASGSSRSGQAEKGSSMQIRLATSEARGLTAAAALGIIGALTIFIAPGFVGLVADQGKLGEAGAGYVISSDINTMAVAIGAATFLITRVSWRQLAFAGLVLIAAGSLATAFVHTEG